MLGAAQDDAAVIYYALVLVGSLCYACETLGRAAVESLTDLSALVGS
jgi:hypothetical protein